MNERDNGNLPVPNRAGRSRVSADIWQQVKTAYASGIGLREIARNMNIPEGTVLARAKREDWTREIESAKALAKRDETPLAVSPVEAVALSMQQRGERHVGRMAGVSERGVDHVEKISTRLPGARLAFPMTTHTATTSWSTLLFWTLILIL
ncbi:MAG: hypothetical protein E6L08_14995 [Verrucomicrobia bacterium]|nr:MAG: hypothetical protein E6L08_14995 [Verrucomicrobiota bacterium]